MNLQEVAECRRVSLSKGRPRAATVKPPFCRCLLALTLSTPRVWGNKRENTGYS